MDLTELKKAHSDAVDDMIKAANDHTESIRICAKLLTEIWEAEDIIQERYNNPRFRKPCHYDDSWFYNFGWELSKGDRTTIVTKHGYYSVRVFGNNHKKVWLGHP
jgi:hypothetical protein|tara:strand:+ start:1518 stop:1832 length:315 start_codon:yes stop_codon:yes gene_type:complete